MNLKFEDVKSWDDKAIQTKVSELRSELFNLKMQKAATGAVDKPHTVKLIKKSIARLLTAKNNK
jgi:large subunit ribosomal protein L29